MGGTQQKSPPFVAPSMDDQVADQVDSSVPSPSLAPVIGRQSGGNCHYASEWGDGEFPTDALAARTRRETHLHIFHIRLREKLWCTGCFYGRVISGIAEAYSVVKTPTVGRDYHILRLGLYLETVMYWPVGSSRLGTLIAIRPITGDRRADVTYCTGEPGSRAVGPRSFRAHHRTGGGGT